MESNTSDPEYRNLFRANNQLKQTPRPDKTVAFDPGYDYQSRYKFFLRMLILRKKNFRKFKISKKFSVIFY